MTPRSVGGHVVHDRRRGLLGWAAGIAVLAGLVVAFWPAVAEDPEQMEQLMRTMPEEMLALFGAAVEDLVSPPGYLDSQLFAMITPLLFLLFAIGGVARTLAAEEQDGRLEVLLANPVARRRVLLEKAGAVGGMLVVLALVHFGAIVATGWAVDLDIGLGPLAAVHVSLLLLAALFGALALAVAAATGRRGLAIGLTAGLAAVAYLLDSFAPIVDWLEPFRPLSPFYLYRGARPLHDGLDPLHAGVLAVLVVVLVVAAVQAFDRRDIGTG
jgi:ABC-2 type transport system permease protein